MAAADTDFPYSLVIDVPFPTPRLAAVALGALSVDKELSPHVHRAFSTVSPSTPTSLTSKNGEVEEEKTVLRTEYRANTNRMLRVAVNAFMDSLCMVIEVMEELDEDVLDAEADAEAEAADVVVAQNEAVAQMEALSAEADETGAGGARA